MVGEIALIALMYSMSSIALLIRTLLEVLLSVCSARARVLVRSVIESFRTIVLLVMNASKCFVRGFFPSQRMPRSVGVCPGIRDEEAAAATLAEFVTRETSGGMERSS